MALNKVTYVDGVTVIGADNLNDIQDAIIANENATDYALAAFPTDTASGSIVSIPDGADNIPVKSMTVQIEPSQDLHGYDNPWPAGGGKNVFDQDTILANITSTLQYYPILVGSGNFTMSTNCPLNTNNTANLFLLAGQVSEGASTSINGVWNGNAVTVTAVDDYITVAYRNLYDVNPSDFNSQIEKGSEATSFAPFSNECPVTGWTGANIYVGAAYPTADETYTVDWQDEAGTVYGGTLTDNGDGTWTLRRTYVDVDLGTLNYSYHADTQAFDTLAVLPGANTAASSYTSGICECLYWNTNSQADMPNGSFKIYGGYLYIKMTDYSDPIALKSALSGKKLVYAITTPQTYLLTAETVKSLLGQNNIWADTGDVSVTYRADVGLYIDKKLGA